jgi:cell division protein FtsI/penicillin-binding protein 2
MATIAATVANGGIVHKPSLVYKIQETDGTMIRRPEQIRGNLLKDTGLTEDQVELLRRGMWRVVN